MKKTVKTTKKVSRETFSKVYYVRYWETEGVLICDVLAGPTMHNLWTLHCPDRGQLSNVQDKFVFATLSEAVDYCEKRRDLKTFNLEKKIRKLQTTDYRKGAK